MYNFDIIKKSDIEKTFRVAKIMADFDVSIEHSFEHFIGEIKMPEKWNIGVIVGASGTGKSTIAHPHLPLRSYDCSSYQLIVPKFSLLTSKCT